MPNITDGTILMDRASIYKSKDLSDILAEGVTKIINVPYSPLFNPIEFIFYTLKHKIKFDVVTTKKQLDKILLRYFKQATGKASKIILIIHTTTLKKRYKYII